MVLAQSQMLGLALAIIGWLGSIIACALPMWMVLTPKEIIPVMPHVKAGLWMTCASISKGPTVCLSYESLQGQTSTSLLDLHAARALIVIAILAGVCAIALAVIGGKGTNIVGDERAKAKVVIASGVVFIIAALLVLGVVGWFAYSIIHVDDQNITMVMSLELGASVHIGYGSAGLMVLGGIFLCRTSPPSYGRNHNANYSNAGVSMAASS